MATARTGKFRESQKKEILELLAKGYGVKATCEKLGLSRPTYYNWRKADKQFDYQCEKILSDPTHKERILAGKASTDAAPDLPWQEKFLRRYRLTGDKGEAATFAGKNTTDVAAALDSHSDKYDADFHMAYLDEEQRRIWLIEDNLIKKAEHDSPSARFVLSNLMKEKYGKVEGTVTVTNQHWFTQHGQEDAGQFLDGLFGRGTSGVEDRPDEQLHRGTGPAGTNGGDQTN